jgi:hypothetical protein
VKGGEHTSHIYAIRTEHCEGPGCLLPEVRYDRTLLVAIPGAASRRSSEVEVHVHVSRSPIVEVLFLLGYSKHFLIFLKSI